MNNEFGSGSPVHTSSVETAERSVSELNFLLASIKFKEEKGIRFYSGSGSAEHNGEKIKLDIDLGCGINISYKGKRYRLDPSEIIGAVIDAIDGTTCGR